MKFFRAIQFFFRQISWGPRTAPTYSFDVEKKPNWLVYTWGVFAGFFYSIFQRRREQLRALYRNQERRKTEYTIPMQIVRQSMGTILVLILTLVGVTLADWGVDKLATLLSHVQASWFIAFATHFNFFTIPDKEFFKLVLEISIGAISAILGLLFALYAVGLQLTTDKYSSKVSDYVNQETVGNFFFKLLVFTDIFAIAVLLRVQLLALPSPISFIAVVILVVICLLGILVFKNHYILTIKPKNLFERLQSDMKENIRLASDRTRYSYKSWSIVQTSRMRTQDHLSILKTLFEDLWHAENWNDVIYTPMVLANLITEYAKRKKYIDRERGWWFPQTQVEVKANSMSTLTLKLNFELQGKGPLRIGSPDYLWFENGIFDILKAVESRVGTAPQDTHLLKYVIDFYQTALAGDYEKDEYGRYQKTVAGLYENQETDAFEKYLDAFFALYERVQTDDELGAYLNAYFAIGLTLIDGFDYTKYQEVIKSLIGADGQLTRTREELARLDLPGLFYNQILDYWDRLDLEVQCEGRVITPQDRLEKETLDDAHAKEKQYFDKFFEKLITHHNTVLKDLYQKGKHKELAMFIKARFEWISRLLYINKVALADEYGAKIAGAGVYLPFLPKQILLDSEFWEELEKTLFPSVIENCPTLFKVLSGLLTLMLPVINADEKNVDNIMYRNRLGLILGGFVYLVCEFRQDYRLLIEYVQTIEVAYQPGQFVKAMEVLSKPKEVGGLDLTLKLINWELTRYHHWFGEIMGKVFDLPKTYDHVRFYSGLQEVADHPSKFIRELSYHLSQPEEESAEAFVEWVKKREAMRQLVEVLEKIKEKKI
ncbi:MAG: hypothetical protein B7X04_04000 [Parcubacteria group bacterium 21-54-25]|nr:MAG: hypothetical protein B7X04_04000 [Parcubacteria group bacterium 21-54-25]HQU08155.1 DUF2254 family protein [Candidatus Paceibacterota bacterium]